MVSNEFIRKEKCGYEFIDGDFKSNPSNIISVIVCAFLGSILSALCGLAPGMVFGSGFMMVGLDP